jgi:hypothetical protein
MAGYEYRYSCRFLPVGRPEFSRTCSLFGKDFVIVLRLHFSTDPRIFAGLGPLGILSIGMGDAVACTIFCNQIFRNRRVTDIQFYKGLGRECTTWKLSAQLYGVGVVWSTPRLIGGAIEWCRRAQSVSLQYNVLVARSSTGSCLQYNALVASPAPTAGTASAQCLPC